ncbi:MAG: cation:proton antiporter [Bacteroidales bacterium]|nr:cation:proton antiporter [Bacteroidales bacterium]
MDFLLLKDIVIILGLAIVVVLICHRFKIPTIIGYLITGIIAGPNGFKLIQSIHEVEMLAEIGVIILLFTIGIEFSIKQLAKIKKAVFQGGSLQVLLTIAVIFFIARAYTGKIPESVFIGFLIALSSTAIVLKLLQEKAQLGSPQGQTSLAILIYQDIIIVLMILLTPIIAGQETNIGQSFLLLILKAAGIILLMIFAARRLVPMIMYQIAKTKSRELFVLSIIVIAFAVAWLTNSIGLSLALGAFLAGLIISESEYSQQAFGNIIPFLDVFTSFFFISIGMLFNINTLLEEPLLIIAFTAIVLIIKTLLGSAASLSLGYPMRIAIITGLTLSQVGEFSFILAKIGLDHELLSAHNYQLFLSVSVITMAATPYIIKGAPRVADAILKLPLPQRWKEGAVALPDEETTYENHLIIVGYGINGRNVSRAAKFAGISYQIIEMNPQTIREESEKGEPIFYGDAAQQTVLEHAGIHKALILVVTIADAVSARRITQTARRINPQLHIIIRTRFLSDMHDLYELGADEVIPEEFETSVEIFTRVMNKYLVPRNQIEELVNRVRSDNYRMFRQLSVNEDAYSGVTVEAPVPNIISVHVCKNSPMDGNPINHCRALNEHKVSLLAVSRGGQVYSQPQDNFLLQANDLVFFIGDEKAKAGIFACFKSPGDDSCEK